MFRATGAASMKYTGTGLEKLAEAAGQGFTKAVESAGKSIEEKFPQVVEAKIQTIVRGTTPHRSSKDPLETQDVVTISYHTEKGTRQLSIHAHEDGTWKEFLSRAGRRAGS